MTQLEGKSLLMESLFLSIICQNTAKISRSSPRNQRIFHCFGFSNDSLYQGSIRFNILLGANRDVTQDEIDNAAKDANVLSVFFILSNYRFLNSFKVSPQDMIPS